MDQRLETLEDRLDALQQDRDPGIASALIGTLIVGFAGVIASLN